MYLGNSPNLGKPQPHSSAGITARVERIEDVLLHCSRNTRSVIFDDELHFVIVQLG